MDVTLEFAGLSEQEIKSQFDGATLTVYPVACPASADLPIERSSAFVTYTFATPAFDADLDGVMNVRFVANPVTASGVGTPGFAHVRKADGRAVADFSAGPGVRKIQFGEASFSPVAGSARCLQHFPSCQMARTPRVFR